MQTGIIAQVTYHTLTHIKSSKENKSKGVFGAWQPRSGGIGARALNPITAGPLPATLLGPLCVSSQPLCSSEHPPKTPGPIGLSPPSNGRSGLVHPGTDDRQAAPSAEYYYTSRSYTYEQKQQERALTWRCVPSSTGTPQLQLPQICVPFCLLDHNAGLTDEKIPHRT